MLAPPPTTPKVRRAAVPYRCCPAGTVQCCDCWRQNFVQCTRNRVSASDLHRLHRQSAHLGDATSASRLACVVTGDGVPDSVPDSVRAMILDMVDDRDAVDAVARGAADWRAAHDARRARAKIYAALCDNATKKCAGWARPVRRGSVLFKGGGRPRPPGHDDGRSSRE